MWYNYLSRSNRKKWVEADTFNEIITGRRVDICGNGCLAVKPEGIINYLINANNEQLKHRVVDIQPAPVVWRGRAGDANHCQCFSQEYLVLSLSV